MASSAGPDTASAPIAFSADLLKSFKPSKSLKYHKGNKEITSIDFDDSGAYCITSGEDETIQLYDATLGKHSKTVHSKKYGASLARFTHHATNCIYASTKEDGMRLIASYELLYYGSNSRLPRHHQISISSRQHICSIL